MNDFLIYTIKLTFGLGLFTVIYYLVFPRDSNFRARRFYILFSIFISLIIPFIKLYMKDFISPLAHIQLTELSVSPGYSGNVDFSLGGISIMQGFKVVYFLILAFFTIKIAFQTIKLISFIKTSVCTKRSGFKMIELPENQASFSFFRNIFINRDLSASDAEKIIAHEEIHSKQWHTVDVILIEFLSGLFWVNPFLWLLKAELRNLHEYLADEGILLMGYSKKEYQLTLMQQIFGNASLSITNNFNHSLLKNRIMMMNNFKTGRAIYWKLAILLPISILLIIVFSCSKKAKFDSMQPSDTVLKSAYKMIDKMPEFKKGDLSIEFRKYIAQNVRYPKKAAEAGVAGKVFVKFIVDENGNVVTRNGNYGSISGKKSDREVLDEVVVVGYKPAAGSKTGNVEEYVQLLKDEAVRVISNSPRWEKPGILNGKPVAVAFTFPINFVLQ